MYDLEIIDIDNTFGLNGNCSTLQESNVLEQLEPVTPIAVALTNSSIVKTNIKNKKSTYIEELLEINNSHMAVSIYLYSITLCLLKYLFFQEYFFKHKRNG